MDPWFCRLLLSLSTVPWRVSHAAVGSSQPLLAVSWHCLVCCTMHHGLHGSPGAGHLDCFQVFAVANVCTHASLGARFPWLRGKDHYWASLYSVPFCITSPVLFHPISSRSSLPSSPTPHPSVPFIFILFQRFLQL